MRTASLRSGSHKIKGDFLKQNMAFFVDVDSKKGLLTNYFSRHFFNEMALLMLVGLVFFGISLVVFGSGFGIETNDLSLPILGEVFFVTNFSKKPEQNSYVTFLWRKSACWIFFGP